MLDWESFKCVFLERIARAALQKHSCSTIIVETISGAILSRIPLCCLGNWPWSCLRGGACITLSEIRLILQCRVKVTCFGAGAASASSPTGAVSPVVRVVKQLVAPTFDPPAALRYGAW